MNGFLNQITRMTKANCGHNKIVQDFIAVQATRCRICGIIHLSFKTTEPFTIKEETDEYYRAKEIRNIK